MTWQEQTKENYKRYHREWMEAIGINVTDELLEKMWIEHNERFDQMGKYDDVSRRLITHVDELMPFAHMGKPRDWNKIDQVQQSIPLECDRLLTEEEILTFYE